MEMTKSRLRQKVLLYFYTNTDANVYLRELASILKEDPGNLSKELRKLEKEGIFNPVTRGNQKYITLNQAYPLYKELKSIIFKTIGIEGSLRGIVSHTSGVASAFIYGSFAEHNENSASDIDLLIIGNPDENALMEEIDKLEPLIGREINYTIYSEAEFKRKQKQQDSFIRNINERPKIVLKSDD
jgi:predicted nucleotidyltransferase